MIIHVAGIDLNSNTGMGRIALEWKKAFEAKGFQFLHISQEEVGLPFHPLLFGRNVRQFIKKEQLKPKLILAHEPIAGWLKFKNIPLVSFSHGVEERAWQVQQQYGFQQLSTKARLLPSAIRFYSNNKGFKEADLCLLSNSIDQLYLSSVKHIITKSVVFKNGYYAYGHHIITTQKVFLFNASWLPRKGVALLIQAFNSILLEYPEIKLLIAGASLQTREIMLQFHSECITQVLVLPKFDAESESEIYSHANIFVLPSFFEGQSLALTQAMAMGLCPIVANNSGQSDVIKHLENGLLFETGNANDFIIKLRWAIQNFDKIREMGENAKNAVKHFTWPVVSNQVVNWCKELI